MVAPAFVTMRPPAVARHATRLQWAVVAGYLLLLAFAEYYGEAGGMNWAPGLLASQLIRLGGWAVVVPAGFVGLDRFPLIKGHWPAHLIATVGVAVLAGVVYGSVTFGLGQLVGLAVAGMASDLAGAGGLGRAIVRGATGFPMFVFLPHLLIQRILLARQRRDQEWERELSLAKAKLRVLSVELQPHFLFNTLNSIAGLVRNDPRTAETMLVRLSDLLRLTLEAPAGGESSLGEEIERLELYVGLQRMRFGSRLEVRTAIPAEIRRAGVPSMLLQPLVENALAHGIGPKEGPGTIAITGSRRGDRLHLAVEDDGVGLPGDAPARERIGIGNTRARLAALFPDDHRFELAAGDAGGVRVTIDIPYRPTGLDARPDR